MIQSKPVLKYQAALESALLFVAIFLIYIVSPMITSGDSHFVIATDLTLIRHARGYVDEYTGQFAQTPWAVGHNKGHYWNMYPFGVPLLSLPFVWAADIAAGLAGIDLEAAAIQKPPLFLELTIASIFTAAAAVLLFLICRKRLSLPRSLLLAGLFAFGTPAYSSASRALWQHGPSMLLFCASILIWQALPRWKMSGAVALGIVAGCSYTVRSSNVAVIAIFAILIGFTASRMLLPYFCGAVAGVAPLFAFHLLAFGTWWSWYYRITQGSVASGALPIYPLLAILFSPSRGLFVFSPFLIFALLRLSPAFLRRYPPTRLEIAVGGLAVAWIIGTARWPYWWGGGSYGPRLLAETAPCLTILLIPVAESLALDKGRWRTLLTIAFIVAGSLSIAIHFRGAVSPAVYEWNALPVSVTEHPERVWSWRDAQFLRGLIP